MTPRTDAEWRALPVSQFVAEMAASRARSDAHLAAIGWAPSPPKREPCCAAHERYTAFCAGCSLAMAGVAPMASEGAGR